MARETDLGALPKWVPTDWLRVVWQATRLRTGAQQLFSASAVTC
jgi:hypothetical protein